MNNSVVYNEGSVQVKDPRKEKVVVYAHPEDKISLDFDISSLKKEIVNGDLVIRTQSGGTVTIANYSIMYMQNQFPVVVDSLAQEYGYYDFLDGVKLSSSSDRPDSFVLDRVVSTPKAGVSSGDYLTTGRDFILNDYAVKELVGMIDVDEQHPILANDVYMNPYILLTLYPEGKDKYDVPVTFRYAGRTILNQEEPSTLPVVTRISNPKTSPIYGTNHEFFTPGDGISQGNEIRSTSGGGDKKGDDYSRFMTKDSPEHLNYESQRDSIYYKAYNGNEIKRGLNLFLTDSNTIFQSITLKDVPNGVTFVSTEKTEVQPLGNGAFLITPKSSGNSIDLYFTYKEANAIDSFGNPIGMKEIMEQVRVSIEGFNSKYEQLVIGSTEIAFDFRKVYSENDINNFSLYNTYTYSTLFDPLVVTLSRFNDLVIGGVVSHTYELLEGDDIFWSGDGDETVYMGEGSDTFYYNFGNDTVDGKANIDNVNNPQINGVDVLRFDHERYVNQNNTYIFNTDVHISFANGNIKVFNEAINSRGVKDNSNSLFRNFDQVYLEEDTGLSANQNNTLEIGDTSGFYGLKIFSGGGNDTLKLTMSSLLDFTDAGGASVSSSLARNNPTSENDFNRDQKIYFAPLGRSGKDVFANIIGSSGNDYFLASENNGYDISFNGGSGTDTIDFSNVSGGVNYNVATGKAIYGKSQDTLTNIDIFIGTSSDDTIFGSGTGSLIIYGVHDRDAGAVNDVDLVTYSLFTGISGKGVEINYVLGQAKDIIYVNKYGRGRDTLYNIEKVEASQANDIFILAMKSAYIIDGLGGQDSIDYSQDITTTGITISIENVTSSGSSKAGNASGFVNKGANTDTFSNIQGITGTSANDTFLVKGNQKGEMIYDGKGGHNILDYSSVSDLRISYNLTKETLNKEIISAGTPTGVFYLDIAKNFSEIIGTDQDDLFTAENNAWETASNVVYNAGTSSFDPNKEVTEGSNGLLNAGDVLFLNYDLGNLNLGVIESIFKNFNTLRLGNNNNSIEYGDTSFNVFWGSTRSTTKDTFSASTSSSTIRYDIKGKLATINSLKLYNFDVLIGSDAGTNFIVTLDATILNVNYQFIGGQSLQDVLDYSATDSSVNLTFDLGSSGENDPGSVTKGGTNFKDTFENIESFVGGQGNDTFYLNPFNTTYTIDGGGGTNIVSFKNYSNAVSDSDLNYSIFKNIQAFELTDLDDSWLISSTAENSRISGGAGTDTINIDARINELTYEVDKNVKLNILGPTPSEHILSNFEIFNGTDRLKPSSDKVTMKVANNIPLTEKGNFYFILNKGDVNYSSVVSGVQLNVSKESTADVRVSYNMKISKQAGSLDYYFGVDNIILTDKDDTIRFDLSDPDSFKSIQIDAGGGSDTIDLSSASVSVIYDSTLKTLNSTAFNVTNWERIKTGEGDDRFILAATDRGLIISSGLGNNILELSHFSQNITIDFVENTDNVNIKLDSGEEIVKDTTGIKTVIGGSGKNIFNSSSSGQYHIDGGSSTDNTLSYSSSNDSAGFSFYLTNDAGTTISKGSSGNTDTIKNIQKIVATKKDDIFTLLSDSNITEIDGGDGRDSLVVDATGATSGFNFDLDRNELTGGNLRNPVKISNFEVLNGSVFDDIFTVTNESVLNLKGEIIGNGGNDTLNARIVDSSNVNVNLYLDLSRGFIYKKKGDNTPDQDFYMRIEGIKTVNLGDGDDIFVFTGNLPTGSYTVNLGGGSNLLSFKDVNYALTGTYTDMINRVVGTNSQVAIVGDYGLQLTQYSDYLEITQTEGALVVDGFGGNDIVDYGAVTDNISVDFTTAVGNKIVIQRGTKTDSLTSFEKFILGSGNNNVNAGGSVAIDIDGGNVGQSTITYESLSGGIVAQLDKGTILKNTHSSADTISNFDIFKDSRDNDIVYASTDYTEIWGNSGDNLLNLSRLTSTQTDTLTYGVVGSAVDDRGVSISSGGSFSIKTTNGTGLGREHTYKTIIFGNYNAVVATNKIEGRTYSARSGKDNKLDYSNMVSADGGIKVDFSAGVVSTSLTSGGTTNVDIFTYFNKVVGTNQEDTFTGLSSSSRVTIDAKDGNDTVSFTGSASALITDIRANGTINTGANGVIINKTTGNLIIGGTRHDDIFYITDMSVFNVNSGINGEGGNNTLDFSKLASGLAGSFEIGATRNYKISNIQRYVFTSQNDTITWSASATNLYVKEIDFGIGDDKFQVILDSIATSGTGVVYQIDGTGGSVNIKSSSLNHNISLLNLEKLALSASGGTIDYFKAIFKNNDYVSAATSGNIFGSQIELNNINFTNGVGFEYRDYENLTKIDTSTIIANITNLDFLGSRDSKTIDINVKDSTTQANNVNIKIYDKVNMIIDNSIASTADVIYDGREFRIATSSTHNQIFNLVKVTDSTITLNSQILQVQSNTTISMPKTITLNGNTSGIDFSNYRGQHGNLSAGTDWAFNNGKLTGKFNNDFEIDTSSVRANIPINLTATNDTLSIVQDRSNFKAYVDFDGKGGVNTLSLLEGQNKHMLNALFQNNGFTSVFISSDNLNAQYAGSTDFIDYGNDIRSNGKSFNNFQIFDARANGVNKDMTNDTIINVILDSTSTWTDIYMPYAKAAVILQNNMQRTILNAAGYDASGTNPQGGFSQGGTYTVSFEQNPNVSAGTPGYMNRMMQVQAVVSDGPGTEKVFNVHNLQSIYGKYNKADNIIFSAIDTNQFKDLVQQFSQGRSYADSGNGTIADARKKYLYLDLNFTKDDKHNYYNGANGLDIVDLSNWQVNDTNSIFDIELAKSEGSQAGGLVLGGFSSTQSGLHAMLYTRMTQNIKFILPQSKIYFGNINTNSDSDIYTLEFPDVKDSDIYGAFDMYKTGYSYGPTVWRAFRDSKGEFDFKGGGSESKLTLVNFTTFFLQASVKIYSKIELKIGDNFANGGLFNSNNVHLYFDQSGGQGKKPTDATRNNNSDTTNTGSGRSNDIADFTSITSGFYYYSRGAWVDREHKSHEFVSTNVNTNRQATTDYEAFLKDTNTGVGVIFANDYDKSKIGATNGLSADVGAFYRMQGVNNIKLTNASNTFALGEVYWSNTSGNVPLGPLVNANNKTFLKRVEGGAGIDTLLENTFTADTKKSGGGYLDGDVKDFIGGGTYNLYWFLQAGAQQGHVERNYIYDGSKIGHDLNMRATSVPESTYGDIQFGSDLSSTMPNTDGSYTAEFARTTYTNFEKLKIEDYNNEGINGYYKGVHDTISVKAEVISSANVTSYREFDLGGRYFVNQAAGEMKGQNVMHEAAGNKVRFQFVDDVDKRVDSSMVVADGYSNGKYTSYYGYKNWDHLDLTGSGLSAANTSFYFIFNSDFNFEKMNKKEFVIDLYKDDLTTKVFWYFQEHLYNYTVAVDGSSGNFVRYRITSNTDSNKYFIIKLWVDNPSVVTFKERATEADIGTGTSYYLSDEQLKNLQQYGNVEGINNVNDNTFLDNGADDGSSGISSYGRSTLNNSEEDKSEYIAYTDGSSGITSFGRGSRSDESKVASDNNASKQEPKAEEQKSQLPQEEEQWFKDNSEELDNNSSKDEKLDNNYSKENMKEEEEEESKSDEDLENQYDSNNDEDSLENDVISFLDQYYNDLNQEESIEKVDFTDFVEKQSDFNMDELFDKSEDLLSNNIELSNSLGEIIDTINSIEEEAVNVTNQMDELDSMSFALDSMFNIDENTGNTEVGVDNNNKNKNTNNFSNS